MSFNVLFFDSGVGGLSVYQEVMKVGYERISPIYLFDNLCCPYGNKPEQFVVDRVVNLLVGAYKNFKIDMIVIACNTASTIALENVRKVIPIPIVGVVPAIKPAAALSKNGIVGLLATPGTISRNYTQQLIDRYAKDVTVLKLGTTALVEIAERKIAGELILKEEVDEIFKPWLVLEKKPDVIVLGCTHFPHMSDEISGLFPNALLVDSGEAIARRVSSLLAKMENHVENTSKIKAYCTNTNRLSDNLKRTFNKFGFEKIELFSL